jgi:hypothetical protein
MWGPDRPLRWAALFAILGVVFHLLPRGSTDGAHVLWAGASGGIAAFVTTLIDKIVARRAPAP